MRPNLSFSTAGWNLRFHFLKVRDLKTTRRTQSRNYKLGLHAMARFATILLVEDDTAVRDVLIRILSEKGFGVLAAGNAYEAVRILGDRPVDVLFADIILGGGMDGVQLAKQARLMRPGIRVLFQTGYAQRATEREAFRLGRVLFKPLRQPEVIQAIEMLLAA